MSLNSLNSRLSSSKSGSDTGSVFDDQSLTSQASMDVAANDSESESDTNSILNDNVSAAAASRPLDPNRFVVRTGEKDHIFSHNRKELIKARFKTLGETLVAASKDRTNHLKLDPARFAIVFQPGKEEKDRSVRLVQIDAQTRKLETIAIDAKFKELLGKVDAIREAYEALIKELIEADTNETVEGKLVKEEKKVRKKEDVKNISIKVDSGAKGFNVNLNGENAGYSSFTKEEEKEREDLIRGHALYPFHPYLDKTKRDPEVFIGNIYDDSTAGSRGSSFSSEDRDDSFRSIRSSSNSLQNTNHSQVSAAASTKSEDNDNVSCVTEESYQDDFQDESVDCLNLLNTDLSNSEIQENNEPYNSLNKERDDISENVAQFKIETKDEDSINSFEFSAKLRKKIDERYSNKVVSVNQTNETIESNDDLGSEYSSVTSVDSTANEHSRHNDTHSISNSSGSENYMTVFSGEPSGSDENRSTSSRSFSSAKSLKAGDNNSNFPPSESHTETSKSLETKLPPIKSPKNEFKVDPKLEALFEDEQLQTHPKKSSKDRKPPADRIDHSTLDVEDVTMPSSAATNNEGISPFSTIAVTTNSSRTDSPFELDEKKRGDAEVESNDTSSIKTNESTQSIQNIFPEEVFFDPELDTIWKDMDAALDTYLEDLKSDSSLNDAKDKFSQALVALGENHKVILSMLNPEEDSVIPFNWANRGDIWEEKMNQVKQQIEAREIEARIYDTYDQDDDVVVEDKIKLELKKVIDSIIEKINLTDLELDNTYEVGSSEISEHNEMIKKHEADDAINSIEWKRLLETQSPQVSSGRESGRVDIFSKRPEKTAEKAKIAAAPRLRSKIKTDEFQDIVSPVVVSGTDSVVTDEVKTRKYDGITSGYVPKKEDGSAHGVPKSEDSLRREVARAALTNKRIRSKKDPISKIKTSVSNTINNLTPKQLKHLENGTFPVILDSKPKSRPPSRVRLNEASTASFEHSKTTPASADPLQPWFPVGENQYTPLEEIQTNSKVAEEEAPRDLASFVAPDSRFTEAVSSLSNPLVAEKIEAARLEAIKKAEQDRIANSNVKQNIAKFDKQNNQTSGTIAPTNGQRTSPAARGRVPGTDKTVQNVFYNRYTLPATAPTVTASTNSGGSTKPVSKWGTPGATKPAPTPVNKAAVVEKRSNTPVTSVAELRSKFGGKK